MAERDYQLTARHYIGRAWANGVPNVLLVIPTGGGKTYVFTKVLADHVGKSVAIAHREELVYQISMGLAAWGCPHAIMSQPKLVKLCISHQTKAFGRSYYDPTAQCTVAGIDTLRVRVKAGSEWANQVTRWVIDEAHHVAVGNKWGNAVELFPNAMGLGVTATAHRADNVGLGRGSGGVFDVMYLAASMRHLIRDGYLTDYKVYAPASTFKRGRVEVSRRTGDFKRKSLVAELSKSTITGDIVQQYHAKIPGKLTASFVTSVDEARAVAERFNSAGVPAAYLHGGSTSDTRIETLAAFRERKILQLVNVDLFGEGFDLPAMEAAIMARPTESLALNDQQMGRPLRVMPWNSPYGDATRDVRLRSIAEGPKPVAHIVDMVGNFSRHGAPDGWRPWSLDGSPKRAPDGMPKTRTCLACDALYEGLSRQCPYCGHILAIEDRSGPEQVDGDLFELSPEVLAEMRKEADRVNQPTEQFRRGLKYSGAPAHIHDKLAAQHDARRRAQQHLRETIACWAGYRRLEGVPDSYSYQLFYQRFGLDVMTAQTLGTKDAQELQRRIEHECH